ncbi:5709_t:CDS:2, partial [Gigaspora rosea]
TTISEYEHELLQKFRTKRNKFRYVLCPTCNESENNMDPGEIPNKLQGLTKVEEMLIAQAFT